MKVVSFNLSHMHDLVKSHNYRGLKLLLSDAKFMVVVNLCSFTIDFKKINVLVISVVRI